MKIWRPPLGGHGVDAGLFAGLARIFNLLAALRISSRRTVVWRECGTMNTSSNPRMQHGARVLDSCAGYTPKSFSRQRVSCRCRSGNTAPPARPSRCGMCWWTWVSAPLHDPRTAPASTRPLRISCCSTGAPVMIRPSNRCPRTSVERLIERRADARWEVFLDSWLCRVNQLQLHLQRRIAEQARQLRLGGDLGRHQVQNERSAAGGCPA